MAKRFTDAQLKGLKPSNKRRILYEDGGKGFGIRVEPSGRKSFFLEFRFGEGKERRNRIITIGQFPRVTLTKARSIAGQYLDQIEHGIDPATKKQTTKVANRNALTVNDLVEEYLEKWAKVKKKERSWREDERLLNKDIVPVMGRKKAKDIRRRDIVLLLDEIVDRGAAITANRVLAVTRKMFNFAVGRDIIDASPCVQIPTPSKENRRERNLSEDEVKIFWNKLDDAKISREIKLALKFLLVTCQRKSEVIEAEWSEIDFKTKWWTIPAGKAKNKQTHRVPLTPMAIEILNEIKEITGEYRFVFASPVGATKRNPNNQVGASSILGSSVDHALRDNLTDDPKTGKINVFKLEHFTPHDLRRTATSMMTRSGVQRLTVKKILNHADREITAVYDRYEYDKEKQKALATWDRKLKTILFEEKAKVVNNKSTL
jgi:integrase